jgi:hypothetical protein
MVYGFVIVDQQIFCNLIIRVIVSSSIRVIPSFPLPKYAGYTHLNVRLIQAGVFSLVTPDVALQV